MSAATSLRYVVLWHNDISEPHFDLMVETYPGSDLATWRSPVWPIEETVTLTRLRNHRRIFLDYEGQLTESRGRVERVGSGNCGVEIGENLVWRIDLLNMATRLVLRNVGDDQWEVSV
jgi:hypothetical protein